MLICNLGKRCQQEMANIYKSLSVVQIQSHQVKKDKHVDEWVHNSTRQHYTTDAGDQQCRSWILCGWGGVKIYFPIDMNTESVQTKTA